MMKIDLWKAYDMVSWKFVEEVLKGYGFPQSFVQMVMMCISSTRLSVKVNGDGHGYFQGKKDLRQGDIISFALCIGDGVLN